ncbi:MAG: SDR family NAD(P)-dependent oxidoreductase [Bacteroidota bacterium]
MKITNIDLTDKKILLTGASDGIGKGIANYLMKMGAEVAVHYNSNKNSAEVTSTQVVTLDKRYSKTFDNTLF